MEAVSYNYPWEIEPYSEGRCDRWGYTYKAEFDIVEAGYRWEKGDIVKFCLGYYPIQTWSENTLMVGSPASIYPKRDTLPMYASNEYGMILTRYKWTKCKCLSTFVDYGSIIIMLTGEKVGRVRRYYTVAPYELVMKYPYKGKLPKEILKTINLKKILNEATSNMKQVEMLSIETRNKYLKLLYDRLNQKESI